MTDENNRMADEDLRDKKKYPSKRRKEKGVKENILDNIDLETIELKPGEIYFMSDGPKFKAKGGRVGLKRGNPLKKETNVEKIKKAFGPKQKPQTRMTGKKKKFPDLTGDGKVTFADILKGRGVINGKKKKKVI